MLRKKYISTGANPLSVDVTTGNGGLRTFDFRGGMKHPVIIPPFYATSDPEEQKLLESYPGFGVSYVLEGVEDKAEAETEVKREVKEEVKSEGPTFDNVQQAKDWLNKEKGVPFSALKNKQMVIAEAEKLKIVLKFNKE